MNPKLTIDPEFEAKYPPLTEDELSQLEENILEEGLVFTPIIVWNNTITELYKSIRASNSAPLSLGKRKQNSQKNSGGIRYQ